MTSESLDQPVGLSIPEGDSPRRFHQVRGAEEWIEDYRPGRLHPVHLGDTFAGRYKVIRKLGYGSFSTVWLAKDVQSGRFAALKLLEAEASPTEKESKILRYLARSVLDHVGKEHVMQLLDAFDHDGPNGTHRCLVFEAMGPSAEAMVDELPENKPKMYDRINRYPLWMAKSMLRQALLGLDFLHQNGIAHGDFQPGNILFSATDLESAGEEELAQDDQRDVSAPVRRLDGRIDPWAPRYVATSQPLAEHADLGPEFVVKLSDMGAAFFLTDPPERPATPASLRSPEMILEGKDGLAQDVWSFGCLVFEFICARPPFVVWTAFRPKEESDDDHLLMFDDTLGPLPDAVRSKWSRSHKYFNAAGKRIKEPNKDQPEPNGTNGISNAVSTGSDHGTNETSNGAATGSANGTNRISNDIATDPEMKTNRISNGAAAISENGTNGISSEGATGSVNGADQETTQLPAFVVKEPEPEFHYPTLEDLFNQNKSPDLDADESATIKALLRQILTYDPDQRPSAAELLKHPWFAGTK